MTTLGRGAVSGWLLRGSVGTFAVLAGSAVVAVGMQMAFTRLLGAAHYGDYVYILSWVNTLAMVGAFGFEAAPMRFIPMYQTQEDWPRLRGYLRRSHELPLIFAVIISIVALGGVLLWRDRLATSTLRTVVSGAFVLPLLVSLKIRTAHLQALRRPAFGLGIQTIARPILLVMMVGALALVRGAVTSDLAMSVNVVASATAVMVSWRAFERLRPPPSRTATPTYETASWVRSSTPFFVITASQTLLMSADTLMLGAMAGTRAAGIYSVASQLAMSLSFAISAVNMVIAPRIAEMHINGKRRELRHMIRMASRGSLAFALVVVFFFLLAGRPLLSVYGHAFEDAWLPLLVLCAGQIAIVICGSVGYLMTMTGHGREASIIIGISALVNLVLNFVLIPRFGPVGAALATSLAFAMRSLLLTIRVRHHLGFTGTAF